MGFHTLRLLQGIMGAAPMAIVQLYALIEWAGMIDAPEFSADLLRLSIVTSIISVGLGLAMWEQKVQPCATAGYIAGVAVLRVFEVASRALTLAIFAGLTHNSHGLLWALLADYGVMLLLTRRHQSVQFTYGIFISPIGA